MEKIKQLREKTGAGIVDCKKALEEADQDIDQAAEILRKKGIAKAYKRTGNEATEGVIKVAVNEKGNIGYILEINSETDFVAKNENFQNLSEKILNLIKEKEPSGKEELESLAGEKGTIREELDNLSGVIGEKLKINKFEVLKGPSVAAYSHLGGKIGSLVSLNKEGEQELALEIAMQVAATNPKYLSPEEIPAEEIEKEKEVYRQELKDQGKPEEIMEKIIEGKIAKYYEEVCLIKQEYIKDDKKKVEDILGDVEIEKYIRYSL